MAERKINRYEIKGEIGRGGMATVFEAFDPRFKRKIALKVLPREFLHDPTFKGRFEREAQTIAALEHPAIVPVYDFGEDNGQPFLVMRYMSGGSLEDRIKKGSISYDDVCNILTRIASALDKAHSAGVIHRDLKPANILFDGDGNPYLADFGIAKITEATSALTGSSIIGTPAYMSPEQAKGESNIDGRSDVYALGIIVYQILSGELPFDADTPMGLALKHITDPAPDIQKVVPNLPAGLNAVIKKALEKDVDDRYATAKEFAHDFTCQDPSSYATREFDLDTKVYEGDSNPLMSASQIEGARVQPSRLDFEEPTVRPSSGMPSQPIPRTPPPSHPSLQQRKKKSGIPLLGIGLGVGGIVIIGLVILAAVVIFLVLPGLDSGGISQANTTTRTPTNDMSYLTNTAEALFQEQTQQVIYQQQTEDAAVLHQNQTATAEMFAQNATATSIAATAELFQAATDVASVYGQWPVSLDENFGVDNDFWFTGDKSDDYMEGNLSISNGFYLWDINALQGLIYRVWDDTITYNDFYVEVEVQLLEGDPYGACYGLAFMQSSSSYYRIMICDDHNYDIYRYDENGWTQIKDTEYADAIKPGEVNKLAVYAEDNSFFFFVNDVLTAEFYDNNLTSGYIGLLVEMVEGYHGYYAFDNLKVYAP